MANSLKTKLSALRKDRDWSLDRLSEETQISKSYLWELENRDKGSPSADKLSRIANALNVTTEFLLDDEAEQPDDGVMKEAFYRKYDRLDSTDKKKINDILEMWSKTDESS